MTQLFHDDPQTQLEWKQILAQLRRPRQVHSAPHPEIQAKIQHYQNELEFLKTSWEPKVYGWYGIPQPQAIKIVENELKKLTQQI